MKALKSKTLGISLGILLLAIQGCKPFEALTVKEPQNVKIQSATITNMSLVVQLPIHNPNLYPIKVKSLQAKAYINNNAVGKITNHETIKIPGKSDKVHTLKLDVDYSDIFDGGFSLSKILRKRNLELKIDGTLKVQSFLLKKKINFQERKSLDLDK